MKGFQNESKTKIFAPRDSTNQHGIPVKLVIFIPKTAKVNMSATTFLLSDL